MTCGIPFYEVIYRKAIIKKKGQKIMAEEIFIKGQKFGVGRPVICVPVVEQTKADIIKAVEGLTTRGIKMLEWRMDWFSQVDDPEAVREVLLALEPLVRDIVLLCTFRSRSQGGERELAEVDYMGLNRMVADSGVADIVDLEYLALEKPGISIVDLKARGIFVILSHHDFEMTPVDACMQELLVEMWDAGADFAKLAVMPMDKYDVIRLLKAVMHVKESRPESHIIAMSMGNDGAVSRILGQWYASEVTFASVGKTSAPGQIPYENLQRILGELEEYI